MKKLMFATALGASVAAFGAGEANAMNALSATSFEGYSSVAFVSTNTLEQADDGQEVTSFFSFVGDSDSSVVKTFGGENAAAPAITRPKYYQNSAAGSYYLALDTEGGTLWRALALDSNNQAEDTAVAATGTYLDTLVQFTVTEDEAPEVDSNTDKLAIWLQADSETGETNLMVRAAIVDDSGNLTPTNFVISNASVEPNTWHRLTVKAIADVTEGDGILAFQIFLDSNTTPLKSSLLSFTDEFIDLIESDYKSAIVDGSVFASLQGAGSVALTGVGFKGTGAVDDIVWTEENPIEAPAPAYPDYLETADSTIKGKYDDWKTTYSADTASVHENEFLVNANPATTTVTSNALEITEIKENTTDGGWDITIGCSVAGVDLTGAVGSTIVCNGYLAVSYTDDLAGTWTTENIAVTEVDATTGTVTVNVNKSGAKFMKVSLTVAPQPAAGE